MVSWMQPGKIMRVMTQTTKDAFENIDFACKTWPRYILFDWKWYSPAFTYTSDATNKVAIPDFDLPGIIKYGKEKRNRRVVDSNLQGIVCAIRFTVPRYRNWGVKGVKFGFVQAAFASLDNLAGGEDV